MTTGHKQDTPALDTPTAPSPSLEQVLSEIGRRGKLALRLGVVKGTLVLTSAVTLTNLAAAIFGPAIAQASINEGSDWAQDEGTRDEGKVHYYGESWSHTETTGQTCGERGCYGGTTTTTAWVKIRVQPQSGADLDAKRVGVVYRDYYGNQATAVGSYFSTHADGYEEWHVPVVMSGYQTVMAFTAWYQDGTGQSPTWYDDNMGELHVVTMNGHQAIRRSYATDVSIDDTGVHGSIVATVTDIDYDKDIRLVYTTDNWSTVEELSIGEDELNAWQWVSDSGNSETWQLELELPGSFDHIEYALVYRHGVVNGADEYEYWDNNYGQNYRVELSTES
ncbi:hypothetical protein G6O69_03340 [Pseudenhygromyxa sp. WMMC2535]|uniref:carbohydrate-binding protein n=1 Tax=Pseudenhygromyxa sp. WMMC2535 TaxID=2712867 RepID=UPI0015574998|nr:carbohydrate-binding protein [Pseudenhygromyxa sp. WMMC2535]NVB36848.1 hypothetical protein [Pseudenhygromyxa sp. WMMC2535]